MQPAIRRISKDAHRVEMKARRERQRNRQPGVTPMPSKRVDGAIQNTMVALLLQSAQEAFDRGHGEPITPEAARDEAIRLVTRTLPRPAMVYDWAYGRPSKQDNPAYRKN